MVVPWIEEKQVCIGDRRTGERCPKMVLLERKESMWQEARLLTQCSLECVSVTEGRRWVAVEVLILLSWDLMLLVILSC